MSSTKHIENKIKQNFIKTLADYSLAICVDEGFKMSFDMPAQFK